MPAIRTGNVARSGETVVPEAPRVEDHNDAAFDDMERKLCETACGWADAISASRITA